MLISSSKKMKDVIDLAEKAAKYLVNVLILGETGCGKELIARHVHEVSPAEGKFISINCTALPKDLLESELFGYTKGAFTGAYSNKKGLMELATNGTLLLDEIGDMSLNLQPKLLRVLESKKFTPLGSTKQMRFGGRVVATTNKDLTDTSYFRSDLYFRLSTIIINIPPLRERPDDIISLTNYFLGKIQEDFKLNKYPTVESEDIYDILLKYPWPGNVRELKNILERAIILGDGNLITDIIRNILQDTEDIVVNEQFVWQPEHDGINTKKAKAAIEKYLVKYLYNCNPKLTRAELAKVLDISVPTLINKYKNIIPKKRGRCKL